MKVLGRGLAVVLVSASAASAQLPPPPARSCQEERDHLRVLVKMVADGRGNAEWALAEAVAKQQQMEAELKFLREAMSKLPPPAKPEDKK